MSLTLDLRYFTKKTTPTTASLLVFFVSFVPLPMMSIRFYLGVYLDGEYGLSDVVLNVPVVVTKEGASKILNYKLLTEELEALHASAKVMQNMAQKVYG